ncbi:site-specific DNA recombinase [Caloramator quimbayensis]|uniref:Site-specific DNA recombinase n=1 Tax=Caloramator quimbayensis TaxID=1147123 RepID=A0A1T4WYB4_9CLOT|nr:recombinase family protein [Caloramator quimbayensis]SKA82316.1 site-specific DNA recombinase [Caloramator quimbayensis]
MKIAIYSRKSKFSEKGESIENQVQLCKEYAQKHFNTNEFIIYEDEGFSGKNTNRPEFQHLIKDAKDKKFNVLICYRLDRISRNIADFSMLINQLQEFGISFISIREQFDTSTPMGRAMMYIAGVFAQLERETIAERVRDNMLELAKSGRWLGGQTPLGFNSEAIQYYDENMKPRKMYKLSPINTELEIVNLIYEKYLELKSLSQVNKFLLSNHYKTKQHKDWNKKQIQEILTNPVYVKSSKEVVEYLKSLGITVVGKPDSKHAFLTYNKKIGTKSYRNISEWIAAISRHEGIIDGDKWLEVQKTLQVNKEKAPRLGKTNTALLTGILKCAHCGCNMRVAYGHNKTYYYTCSLKVDSGKTRCSNPNIRGDELETLVINKLKDITLNPEQLIKNLSELKETATTNNTDFLIENLEKKIHDIKMAISNLIKQLAYINDDDTAKYIREEIEILNKEIKSLNKEKTDLIEQQEKIQQQKLDLDMFTNILKKFGTLIDQCTLEEKKFLISSIVKSITWDGEKGDIKIILFGENGNGSMGGLLSQSGGKSFSMPNKKSAFFSSYKEVVNPCNLHRVIPRCHGKIPYRISLSS